VTDTRLLAAPGTLLGGRYRLGSLLGAGGMATVYRAHDERLSRDVALKLFRPDIADAQDLRRIRSEIRMLAGLNHASLVTLHDASEGGTGEAAYLVLELVDGPTLADLFADGALSPVDVSALLEQVADALGYIASRGVVHRDIKPENILVTRDGDGGLRAKLTDLGIARIVDESRLTVPGAVLGTAGYLSPEQVTGRPVGTASDVYSLGLVLLEGLTGRAPFAGSASESAVARTVRAPRLPAGLDPADAELLRGMTAVDPEDRLSARQARDGLRAWRSPGPFLLSPTEFPGPGDATLHLPALEDATRPLAPAGNPTERLLGAPAADRTRRLVPAPDGGTELLPTVGSAGGASPAPVSAPRRRRRGAGWLALLLVLLVGATLGVIAAWPAITAWVQPGPAEPPPAYPAVEGDLGTSLGRLQGAIEGEGLADDLTLALRDDLLAVSTASAVTDYPSAVSSLEDTAAHVDAAALDDQVSSAKYRVILASIDAVQEDLDSALAAEQAELARLQEQRQLQQQEDAQGGILDGLRERLDRVGREVQRQIDSWTNPSTTP
jgi:tRNA A-37 threonylcarbamoyl transferase component Bud32